MKKALLFAALALSMNAVAQSGYPGSNPKEKFQDRIELKEFNQPGIASELNRGQSLGHQLEPCELVMIFDSIRYWKLDTHSLRWEANYKINGIVYDTRYNLISFINQVWDGSTWKNLGKYTRTYDARNNETNGLSQQWNGSEWVNVFQDIYTYDASDNQTSYTYMTWNGSAWVNNDQYSYT